MLVDLRKHAAAAIFDCDIAIVGAGAAGLTLARHLAGRGRDIVVVESGGLDFDAATQGLLTGRTSVTPTIRWFMPGCVSSAGRPTSGAGAALASRRSISRSATGSRSPAGHSRWTRSSAGTRPPRRTWKCGSRRGWPRRLERRSCGAPRRGPRGLRDRPVALRRRRRALRHAARGGHRRRTRCARAAARDCRSRAGRGQRDRGDCARARDARRPPRAASRAALRAGLRRRRECAPAPRVLRRRAPGHRQCA